MILKTSFYRFFLLCVLAISFLMTCKSPSGKTSPEEGDTGWIEEMTISQLQQGYKEGRYTIADIVKVYLDRINEIDKNGPGLNSVIQVNPDALQIAEELDSELAAGKTRGPLHGVPVILKDNIDTHDKMANTAGSTALRNSYPKEDSFVAKKLRNGRSCNNCQIQSE